MTWINTQWRWGHGPAWTTTEWDWSQVHPRTFPPPDPATRVEVRLVAVD